MRVSWVILAVLIVLSLWFILSYPGTESTEPEYNISFLVQYVEYLAPSSGPCENLSGLERYSCYTSAAVGERNTSVCDVLDSNMREACLEYYRAEYDPSQCETKASSGERIVCWHELGIVLSNTSLCDKIVYGNLMRDRCYFFVAYDTRVEGLCDSIAGEEMRLYCMAYFSGNISLCDEVLDVFRFKRCRECVGEGDCILDLRDWNDTVRWW